MSPSAVAIIVSLVCVVGDDGAIPDSTCWSTFEVDTVHECATYGDPSVPLHINTGNNNPGPGLAVLMSGTKVIARVPFESRGAYQQGAGHVAVYVQERAGSFADGFEPRACACHTRAVDPVAACEVQS